MSHRWLDQTRFGQRRQLHQPDAFDAYPKLRTAEGLDMPDQLRMYTIRPGEMATWLEEWGRQIVPLRRRLGFEILGAWTTEPDQFVWILGYAGPKTWEEADAAYYASPERTAMQPDPARHIAKSEQWLLSALDVR